MQLEVVKYGDPVLRRKGARVEKITLDAAGKPTGSEPLDVE